MGIRERTGEDKHAVLSEFASGTAGGSSRNRRMFDLNGTNR
jgi:hypothetical protein